MSAHQGRYPVATMCRLLGVVLRVEEPGPILTGSKGPGAFGDDPADPHRELGDLRSTQDPR